MSGASVSGAFGVAEPLVVFFNGGEVGSWFLFMVIVRFGRWRCIPCG